MSSMKTKMALGFAPMLVRAKTRDKRSGFEIGFILLKLMAK